MAELLRGDYKPADYGKVILPFTVLRRLDCVLEPTKAAVLAEFEARAKAGLNPEPFLLRKAGQKFFNTSTMDLKRLLGDAANVGQNLHAYIAGFLPEVRDIFERFEFAVQIDRLAKAKLLNQVAERFAAFDLHPDRVSNMQMGLAFEELIRRFAGRFGPGLPRVSDGSLLFLMHMLSKMRPDAEGGCRFGIVLNGTVRSNVPKAESHAFLSRKADKGPARPPPFPCSAPENESCCPLTEASRGGAGSGTFALTTPMADVDPALVQQVLDVAQRQRSFNVHHHH